MDVIVAGIPGGHLILIFQLDKLPFISLNFLSFQLSYPGNRKSRITYDKKTKKKPLYQKILLMCFCNFSDIGQLMVLPVVCYIMICTLSPEVVHRCVGNCRQINILA